jgi:hypothetical protein
MPNAELLIKEAEGLPPEYFSQLLNFAKFLKQEAGISHAAAPLPEKAPLEGEIGIPAWKFFGRSRPPSPEETDAAIKEGCGIAKRIGATLTVDKFLRWKKEDIALEEAQYRERFHKNGAKQ